MQHNDLSNQVKSIHGFIPNAYQNMLDHSPLAASTLIHAKAFDSFSELTDAELAALQLAVSIHNRDSYGISMFSKKLKDLGVTMDDLNEIEVGGLPTSANELQPVIKAVRILLTRRGLLSDSEKQYFEDLGFGKTKLLQVVSCVCQTGILNYANNISKPIIDPCFQQE